jgi:hypothetical protein
MEHREGVKNFPSSRFSDRVSGKKVVEGFGKPFFKWVSPRSCVFDNTLGLINIIRHALIIVLCIE